MIVRHWKRHCFRFTIKMVVIESCENDLSDIERMIGPEFLFLLLEIHYIPLPKVELSLIGGTIES